MLFIIFVYLVWIVAVLGVIGFVFQKLHLDRPRPVKIPAQVERRNR